MAGEDKQMFKQFCQEGLPHVLEALSPPQSSGVSPNKYMHENAVPNYLTHTHFYIYLYMKMCPLEWFGWVRTQ